MWVRTRSELILDRPPWLRVHADEVRLPDGRTVDGYLRIEALSYAVVFAVTADGCLLALRQFKYGTGRVALSLVAGYREPDEDALDAAKRELLEETGHLAGDWLRLGEFAVDGNRGCGTAHLFLAGGARAVQAPDSGDLEAQELVRVPLGDVAVDAFAELSHVACAALALLSNGRRET